ncbi:MAG TPA: hypothetical protein DHU59_08890 [Clostridiales bacterium]|nr:hypothetical protein [Clostridiales bacterium]
MDKRIKEAIFSIMEVESNLEQDFVVDLVKKYVPELDVESLKEREYKTMANRLISSLKDEKGIRDVFVINNDYDMPEYLNVARSKEIDDLKKVRNRLKGNVEGNQKSLSKVEDRLYLLENQISISDISDKLHYKN